jgi:hypothetical protein
LSTPLLSGIQTHNACSFEHYLYYMYIQDLKKMMSETWTEHEGTTCGGLNWERFNNLQHAQVSLICQQKNDKTWCTLK